MQIQFIRHATLIVNLKGMQFLIDPMLSRAGVMEPSPNTEPQLQNPLVDLPSHVDIRTLQRVDAVLLTHTHRDHWDDEAVRLLPDSVPIFCQPEDARKILDAGFTNVTSVSESVTWNGVEITKVGAQHGTGEIAVKMGSVSGYVLQAANEPTIYITGDTVWCEDVQEAFQRKQPDVIVACSGAAQFTTGGPITMTAEDIRLFCQMAPDSRIVVVHLEAWNHCPLQRGELRAYLREHGVGEQVLIPNDGETLEFRTIHSY